MPIGATETLQITLPAEMAQRIRTTAHLTKQPVDEVVAHAINTVLAPGSPDYSEIAQRLIHYLASLSDEDLRHKADARLSKKEQRRLSRLLALNKERDLTTDERAEMDGLMDRVQTFATEGVAARVLLSRRQTGRA